MKYILVALAIFQFAGSTAKAETWSCAHTTVENKLVVMPYRRVGDHFILADRKDLKFKILHESRRVFILSHLSVDEEREVVHVHGMAKDKLKGEGKHQLMSLWYDHPTLNGIDKLTCTKSG